MKKHTKRILIDTIGWLCVLAGIAGLFLPFIQGILLFIIGMFLLSFHAEWAEKGMRPIRNHPRFSQHFDRIDKKIKKIFGF